MDFMRIKLFIEEKADIISPSLAGILEIHCPMSLKEVLDAKWSFFVPAELVIYFLPHIADGFSQIFPESIIQFLIAVKVWLDISDDF